MTEELTQAFNTMEGLSFHPPSLSKVAATILPPAFDPEGGNDKELARPLL